VPFHAQWRCAPAHHLLKIGIGTLTRLTPGLFQAIGSTSEKKGTPSKKFCHGDNPEFHLFLDVICELIAKVFT
jgi:hypothetical protein